MSTPAFVSPVQSKHVATLSPAAGVISRTDVLFEESRSQPTRWFSGWGRRELNLELMPVFLKSQLVSRAMLIGAIVRNTLMPIFRRLPSVLVMYDMVLAAQLTVVGG